MKKRFSSGLIKKLMYILPVAFLMLPALLLAQADNEIQVYASGITPKQVTFVELHQNYTFNGMKGLPDPSSARWIFETLEITRGLGKDWEMGLYTFTGIAPNGKYVFLGNHIRPRFTIPESWGWKVGASISLELGYIRQDANSPYVMDGELRPIIDKSFGNLYFSLNPNVAFNLTGPDKFFGVGPQFKTVYNVHQKFGLGIEYYATLGTFKKIFPLTTEEHLLGPIFDLYSSSKWEMQTGFLFGLTPGSNQQVFKLIVGRRFGK
ncbi:hypothetical protein QWZ08_08175 [Ferruginibacter paludis]|uniref:hypothetical protein n=1 Tax=Ferruginibacter paludis TaxID=1310417 RepID=UPI0025B43AB5|nr:hypothetical protein [Ferruginibacter paludis]MDN3655598.1 hypothetical protein [Ferruginibacter paludis]